MSETQAGDKILERIRAKMRQPQGDEPDSGAQTVELLSQQLQDSQLSAVPWAAAYHEAPYPQDCAQLSGETANALAAHQEFGQIHPRPPGLFSQPIQGVKKVIRRSLTWYTRPLHLFQGAVIRSLQQITGVLRGHEEAIQSNASSIREVQQFASQMTKAIETQRLALITIATELQKSSQRLGGSPVQQGDGSGMLQENKRIISYWNQAAKNDPVRETVSQGANESDDEYLQNWTRIGEYVAGKIMSYSPPRPVALEIGPGMGRISVPMARYCQSILALDISAEMVHRARETMKDLSNFEVQLITDEDLSFLPSEHFDLAYSISCFQHADKKTFFRYLRGMRRALKPGAVLFFGVLNLCSDLGWGHFEAIVENDYPEFFHTPDEITSCLQRAGYSSHQLATEGETLWAIARR